MKCDMTTTGLSAPLTSADLVFIERLTDWTAWYHLDDVPDSVARDEPGVYMFRFDSEPGLVGYVGKSASIRRRLGGYRRGEALLRPPCAQVLGKRQERGFQDPIHHLRDAYLQELPWSGLQVKIGYVHADQIATLERLLINLYNPPWNDATYGRQRRIFDPPVASAGNTRRNQQAARPAARS